MGKKPKHLRPIGLTKRELQLTRALVWALTHGVRATEHREAGYEDWMLKAIRPPVELVETLWVARESALKEPR